MQKAFINPEKVAKPLLAFALGAIEIILDPDNGGIRVRDEIMKSKIRKNIVSFIWVLILLKTPEKQKKNVKYRYNLG